MDVLVLIVDDDESMRATLQEYVSRMGLRVQVASDVPEAERALRSAPQPFDIVLTDLRLPGGSGMDVVKAARARSVGSLVSIVTGYASLETAVEAIRLGAHDYITKPFSLDQIGIHVRNMVERVSLSRENARLSLRLQELLGEIGRLQSERVDFLRLLEDVRNHLGENSRKLDQLLEVRPVPPAPVEKAELTVSPATLTSSYRSGESGNVFPVRSFAAVYPEEKRPQERLRESPKPRL